MDPNSLVLTPTVGQLELTVDTWHYPATKAIDGYVAATVTRATAGYRRPLHGQPTTGQEPPAAT